MKLAVVILPLLLIVLAQPMGLDGLRRPILSVFVNRAYYLQGDGTLGKTDGYVKVRIGSLTLKTRTIWNDDNPRWRHLFHTSRNVYNNRLTLDVMDNDGGRWDDLLFRCGVYLRRSAFYKHYYCRYRRSWFFFSYRYY